MASSPGSAPTRCRGSRRFAPANPRAVRTCLSRPDTRVADPRVAATSESGASIATGRGHSVGGTIPGSSDAIPCAPAHDRAVPCVATVGRLQFAGVSRLMRLVVHRVFLTGSKNRLAAVANWTVAFLGRGPAPAHDHQAASARARAGSNRRRPTSKRRASDEHRRTHRNGRPGRPGRRDAASTTAARERHEARRRRAGRTEGARPRRAGEGESRGFGAQSDVVPPQVLGMPVANALHCPRAHVAETSESEA
jgi:hypothetical protein